MQAHKQTLKEYGRGIVGGLIFSLPLIYTSEMWWTGYIAQPHTLLICILVTFLLLLGYNKYSGTRKERSFKDLCHESVEEIGLAFITSFIFLLLISQVHLGMSLMEILGKVVVESMVVAIGISVGTAELGQKNEEDQEEEQEKENKESSLPTKENNDNNQNHEQDDGLISILVLSICGAVLFASSVAPTEEIQIIAATNKPLHLILMLTIAILLSIVITYFSDFTGSRKNKLSFSEMILHTLIGFLAAIISSFFLLWFFGRIEGYGHQMIIAQMIILAIPAIIGASAGRLLIKGSDE